LLSRRTKGGEVHGLLYLNLSVLRVHDEAGVLKIDKMLFLHAPKLGQNLVRSDDTVEVENHEIAHRVQLRSMIEGCDPQLAAGRVQAPIGQISQHGGTFCLDQTANWVKP
jgi:hypothetical protein